MFAAILFGAALSLTMTIECARHSADRSEPSAVQVELVQRGKIVSIDDMKLEMSDQDGKNKRTYMITKTAKITLDSKEVTLAELKKGDSLTMTIAEGVVTMVAAVRTKPAGAGPHSLRLTLSQRRGATVPTPGDANR